MSSACKRIKLSETIKWEPILAKEYLSTQFTLKKFLVADINDAKKVSGVIEKLHQLYPLADYYAKFKRVRNQSYATIPVADAKPKSKFQVLICPKEGFTGLPSDLEPILTNLSEVDLPIDKILTKKQYELVNKTYWPMSFHLNKYIESLLDKTKSFFTDEQLIRFDFYARMTLELAKSANKCAAALVVDPRTDCLVAGGVDSRETHPLGHSTINVLNNVSKRHLAELNTPNADRDVNSIEECNKDLNEFINRKLSDETRAREYDTLNENLSKKLDSNDYLCTNYVVFLSHEPCSMCAMALVHARASRVFYVFNTKYGYLNTNSNIHCLSSLNHNYEVFEAVDFQSDTACTPYFTEKPTKHEHYFLEKNK